MMTNADTSRLGLSHATYDPDDNKLRLYPDGRLDSEEYARAKSCGFRWAPKQELFFAKWSPTAEDLLLEWCGEIGDEDTSLVQRAEERSERFSGYSANRERDGDAAERLVRELTDNIPLGQPILVGHHSEKRARKDAERIERGMEKAVKMWRTAEYWEDRAAGVVANAAYKDKPAVRARRIKTLEAERRKRVASYTPHGPEFLDRPWGSPSDSEPVPMVMAGNNGRGAWPVPVSSLPAIKDRESRWIAHLDRRLSYEKALLAEQGATHLLEKPKRPKAPPLLNYRADGGTLTVWQKYGSKPEVLTQKDMTKAEYKAVYHESRWTVLSEDKSHRIRFAVIGGFNGEHCAVFLTDSKEHPVPEVAS